MTSIKPLALIAREMVEGTTLEVGYLLPPTVSEHSYALKISDIKRLNNASLVLWLGPDAEPYLALSMSKWIDEKKSLVLLDKASLVTPGGVEAGDGHHHNTVDPHIWLNPILAKKLAQQVSTRLGEIYPAKKLQFDSNMSRFDQKISTIDKLAAGALAPYTHHPFLTQHDAYAYFVNHYQLNQIGVIQAQPEEAMSLKHLRTLQGVIKKQRQGVCFFREPQLSGTHMPAFDINEVGSGELDPLGINAETYDQLIANMTKGFVMCFEQIKRRPDLSQAL